MAPKLRRNFSGAFAAHDLGNGAWELIRAVPHVLSVFVRQTEHGAARAFGEAPIIDLSIEWQADMVSLSFYSAEGTARVEAASAIVHEPLEHLYEKLPLVNVDANARQFWRRIFRLVRLPGGRFLLKLLTSSRRH